MNNTAEPIVVREGADGVSFAVHVQPRASQREVSGIKNGELKIRLTSPPVDGAANVQCIDFLAELLKVRRRDVTIISGETSRHKIVKIAGISAEHLQMEIARRMS